MIQEPGTTNLSYTVYRSKRRRRTVALSIQPEGEVRVLAPAGLSLRKIESFVLLRSDWIRRKLDLLRHSSAAIHGCDFTTGARLHYLGENYTLRVIQESQGRSSCALKEEHIAVTIADPDLSPAALRGEVKLELLLWYKKQARREFQERLAVWSERLGVSYRRLIVTSPIRRWGSCAASGDIRLNWRLMMIPPSLIDYVAAHELCHIRHKNHASSFWNFLQSVMPDYKERRRHLRKWEAAGW